jgi:hypothetical protein
MLTLASRRGDAIALGRRHLKDGWLVYTQEKNRKRKPGKVEVPVAATLALVCRRAARIQGYARK